MTTFQVVVSEISLKNDASEHFQDFKLQLMKLGTYDMAHPVSSQVNYNADFNEARKGTVQSLIVEKNHFEKTQVNIFPQFKFYGKKVSIGTYERSYVVSSTGSSYCGFSNENQQIKKYAKTT